MPEVQIPFDELVDARIVVDPIPQTQLVHLAVGDRAGIVLTRSQAYGLARDLRLAAGIAGRDGRAGAGAARRAASRVGARR